jgi:hypothetical protein
LDLLRSQADQRVRESDPPDNSEAGESETAFHGYLFEGEVASELAIG